VCAGFNLISLVAILTATETRGIDMTRVETSSRTRASA